MNGLLSLLYIGNDRSNYLTHYFNLQGGGGGKSLCANVGLNSSVTECPIEIILSGMTFNHHWFKEFVKSKQVCVHFFRMKVHFRIYLIIWIRSRIEPNLIELCLAI